LATATATKLRPLGDRVVIQPTPREEMTKSGIVSQKDILAIVES
jgi:co-chaperonin GroES (HSP10)